MINWLATWAIAVCLPVLIYWQYWRWIHRRMIKLAELVPGPPGLPIIGNALIFMVNPKEQLNTLSNMTRQYGEYIKFWLGPDLNICVKNPTDLRLLLTSNKLSQKGPVYSYMETFIGPGILTGGPTWRNHRKIATPSYSKKRVHHYSNIFNKEALALVNSLRSKATGASVNVYNDVLHCTTQCVCQTLMGLSKEDSTNVKSMDNVMLQTPRMYSLIYKRITRWWLQIPLVFWLLGGKNRQDYYLGLTNDMTRDIVSKRRKALGKQQKINCDEETMGVVDRYILSPELNDQEVLWETFSVFTTSQEASAKVASAVLLFLSQLPEWQEKVYKEIIDVLGPHDDDVTDEQVKQLRYLDMVFKEAIRYLPIAALIQRTVKEEITINNGKITLPVGTSLVVLIHDLHRDPKYWDEPNKVMPERFLPENVKKRDPNAFIPFSLGPMDCLGRVYGIALIKTIVVRVLRHLHLEPAGPPLEDLQLHVAISVRFAEGYNLKVRPRKIPRI